MVNVRVLFFGKARELVNTSECEVQLASDSMTCKQLEIEIYEKVKQDWMTISKYRISDVSPTFAYFTNMRSRCKPKLLSGQGRTIALNGTNRSCCHPTFVRRLRILNDSNIYFSKQTVSKINTGHIYWIRTRNPSCHGLHLVCLEHEKIW